VADGGSARGAAMPMGARGRRRLPGGPYRAESEGEMKMGQATKWAESQGGCSINSFFFNFKQYFRFKNQRFEILLN
jgi:hypothetical protein